MLRLGGAVVCDLGPCVCELSRDTQRSSAVSHSFGNPIREAAARRSEEETLAIQHRFHVLETALSRTAAYLPAGRDFNEAKAARRALFADDSKRSRAGLSRRGDFDLRFDRLQLRIYSDVLALVLTCAGLAPEARRLARIPGTS